MSGSFPNINREREHRRSGSGFTIVELLIAASITVLIVVMLGVMFSSLAKTAARANQRIDAFRDARAALQMMERDLQNIVKTQWQPDPFSSPTPTVTPAPMTRPAAYFALKDIYSDQVPGNQQLYALISLKNAGHGDVCSVGYYCSWDGDAYSLRRYFRDSTSTYAVLSSPAPTPTPTPPGNAVNVDYISEAKLYKPNPSPSPLPTDDVLARYVWNLKFTAFDAAGNVLPYNSVFDASATDPALPAGSQRPAVIEISFRAMSVAAGRTVVASGVPERTWMNDADPTYVRLIKPNAYEFRARIKF